MQKQPALKQQKYTKSQIQDYLRDQQASNLTLPKYCKKHDLPYDRFVYWRRKLQGPVRPRCLQSVRPADFVPVEVKREAERAEARSSLRVAPAATSSMELVLRGGHTIRVPVDFDAEALRRLVGVMEGAAC
jgi:hypothetical protein